MQPYVIKQGDYLAALAYQYGFDADTVWNDPKNAQLQQLRPNPNILFAGDVLYIPDQIDKPPVAQSLTPGSTNTFVTDPPTVTITVKFSDQTLASQAYTVQELPQRTGLTTGADGTATFTVPVTQGVATIVFTDSGTTVACQVGNLDPISTLSGIFQRLQNLGYIDAIEAFDETNLYPLRAALAALQWDQGAATLGPPSAAPSSSPSPSAPAPATQSPPDSTPSPSSPPSASDATASPLSAPSGDALPDSVDPADVAALLSRMAANSGLADDGTLDASVQSLLVTAHGV